MSGRGPVVRRDLLRLVGGAAVWPTLAHAQLAARDEGVRRVGVMVPYTESTILGKDVVGLLRAQLARRGWTDGRNLQLNPRRKLDDATRIRLEAQTVARWQPDVIFCANAALVAAVGQETDTIPTVFVQVADPVAQGLVKSLSRPGGNLTGIANYDLGMAETWLGTLRELVPGLSRAALIYNLDSARANRYFVKSFQAAARNLKITLSTESLSTDAEIQSTMAALRGQGSGFVVLSEPFAIARREKIIAFAARNKVPGIYPFRHFAAAGGLCAYGVDVAEAYQLGADYIDRILKGEKPAEMPIYLPEKFQLVLNMKTARALKITVPSRMIGQAAEIIQ
jgi:putative tryptophan/tyrosine transport system substrate-binding protein